MPVISDTLAAILRARFQAGAEGFRGVIEIDNVFNAGDPDCDPDANTFSFDATIRDTDHAMPGFITIGGRVGLEFHWPMEAGDEADIHVTATELPWGGTGTSPSSEAALYDVNTTSGFIHEFWPETFDFAHDASYHVVSPVATDLWVWVAAGFAVNSEPTSGFTFHVEVTRTAGPSFVEPCSEPSYETRVLRPSRISIDKSLRLIADQAEADIPNEPAVAGALPPLGFGPSSVVKSGQRFRVYQWFGDPADSILAFTGLLDKVLHHRDPLAMTITGRDLFGGFLIDQTFSTTAPQGADEDGAVRTEANGVYLNREVDYIVSDILNRAGWPTEDRAITATSYVIDEFVIADGASWADTIIGPEKLTGLVGYSAWADEAGVFHFGPAEIEPSVDAALEPDWVYEVGAA